LAEIDPSWYYQAGAGPLRNITVYPLQLLTSLLGPAHKVTALGNQIAPERVWRDITIPVEIDDNNALLVEFASGALALACGTDCHRGSIHPWGSFSLHGSAGSLEVTSMNLASGYPLRYEVHNGRWPTVGAEPREFSAEMTDQAYLQGQHATMEEPHIYADIMDLAHAILEDRPPRASGEQARHVVEIIEKAEIARQTGQTQILATTM
jgi:predicted dehydrogenase